jgi:hypothetical protein
MDGNQIRTIPPHDDRLLNTEQSSAYLDVVHGIVRSPKTLAADRYSNTGPEWVRIGKRGVGYYPSSLDDFARKIITHPAREAA